MPRLKASVWLHALATNTPTRKGAHRLTYRAANGHRYVYNGRAWKRQSVFHARVQRVSLAAARWTGHALLWSALGAIGAVAILSVLFVTLYGFLALLTAL